MKNHSESLTQVGDKDNQYTTFSQDFSPFYNMGYVRSEMLSRLGTVGFKDSNKTNLNSFVYDYNNDEFKCLSQNKAAFKHAQSYSLGEISEYSKVTFQYYLGGIKKCKPIGYSSLEVVLNRIKSPSRELVSLINAIRVTKGDKEKNALKIKLQYFTPAVHLNKWRDSNNITSFTGIMPFDIDKISTDFAIYLREELFKIPEVIATWISSSGCGVRGFVKIPIVSSIDEYKEYYLGFTNSLSSVEFDDQLQTPVQPMFYSYDSGIKARPNAETWTVKYVKPKYVPVNYAPIQTSNLHTKRVEAYMSKAFNRIESNGHPQLRDNCLRLGNLIGAGWISQSDSESLVSRLISSNPYLSQAHDFQVYFKTAKSAMAKGMLNPNGLSDD